MTEFKVEFNPRDLVEFELALKRLDAEVLIKREWEPFLDNFVEVVSKYPPPKEGSKYVRTGNLLRQWQEPKVLDPLTAQVMNIAGYAGWVHGQEQVGFHQETGWIQAFKKGRELIDHLVEKIGDRAERIWGNT